MELNFNQLKKTYLKITLNDKDQTVINVGAPTKKVYDMFLHATEEQLYEVCTAVLNTNKEHKEFTQEEIESLFDYEDAKYLIKEYTVFTNMISKQKN